MVFVEKVVVIVTESHEALELFLELIFQLQEHAILAFYIDDGNLYEASPDSIKCRTAFLLLVVQSRAQLIPWCHLKASSSAHTG